MSALAPADSLTPRVWAGCLHCYNSGRLVGEWFDCTEAAEVDLDAVHAGTCGPWPGCEELWCFDADNVPVTTEMGLADAAAWGEVFEEVGQTLWPALCAWVASGSYMAQGDTDLPCVEDFTERYCGTWPSFEDYARDYAESTGLMQSWSQEAVRYFHWQAWTRDLAQDYTVERAGLGEVHIFRDV